MVVALALTRVLAGLVSLMRARVVRVSVVHGVWVGVALFACVDYWFSLWGLRTTEHWSLVYVMFLLGLAVLLYLCCDLVVPNVPEGETIDLVVFNETDGRKYLGAYFAYISAGIVANLTIAGFAAAVLLNIAILILIGVAWWWRNPRVQGVVVAILLPLVVYYAVTYIPAL